MSKGALKKDIETKDRVFLAMEAASETIRTMTPKQGIALAIRAGILTPEGKLTEPYRCEPTGARKRSKALRTRTAAKSARRHKV